MPANDKQYVQHGVAMTCRSFQEYVDMFQLTPDILRRGRILDVAGGASSFVADACKQGCDVIAADPLYAHSPEAIAEHGEANRREATGKLEGLLDVYDWSYYGSLDRHEQIRADSLARFVDDYGRSDQRHRYVSASLPNLPFPDETFSLIVSSHFLFLYDLQFDPDFHIASIQTLIRLLQPGGEIRLYPLSTLARTRYPALDRVLEVVGRAHPNVEVDFVPTPFRFLLMATEYLRIRRA